MISIDGFPVRLLDGLGFKHLVQVLAPEIRVPSRRKVMKELAIRVKKLAVPSLLKSLRVLPPGSLHLSLDLWETNSKESILGIKVHFLDEDWNLVSNLLAYSKFDGRHTGVNIRDHVRKILEDRGIKEETMGYVIGDNASNVSKAFNMEEELVDPWVVQMNLGVEEVVAAYAESGDGDSDDANDLSITFSDNNDETSDDDSDADSVDSGDLSDDIEEVNMENDFEVGELDLTGLKRIRCLAHTLQLAINDSVKQIQAIKDMVKYLNSIITVFRKSAIRSQDLKRRIKRSLIPIGKTRWNSILFAAERLTEVSKHLQLCLIWGQAPDPLKVRFFIKTYYIA